MATEIIAGVRFLSLIQTARFVFELVRYVKFLTLVYPVKALHGSLHPGNA